MAFPGKTLPKVPFFKDSGRCPKILDYTLVWCYKVTNIMKPLCLNFKQITKC